jgi:nitrous oxide reductase
VAITVSGGKVSGPKGRVKVKQGSTVTLQVTSDVADEVHLHGYDKSMDVEKGRTASLTFKATLTGVFEVELEKRALQLTQLQVQ